MRPPPMESEMANIRRNMNRGFPKQTAPVAATPKRGSDSNNSLLNELTLYSHDYTTGRSLSNTSEFSDVRESKKPGELQDDSGLSFVRLLKRELSRKKIQENGTMTEEYKDNYFKLVETNQTLTKSVNLVKTKIKQYKQTLSSINDKHDESVQLYSNQMEDMNKKVIDEKSKLEEEQRDMLQIRNEIRDMMRKIETFENEIHNTVEARKNAEVEGTYKDCDIVAMNEKLDKSKQDLLQVYKEMESVRNSTRRLNHTKKIHNQKMDFLLNTNEKIKGYFENLLLDNETLKLENKSLEKVLRAHENICLQLLRIAAAKLDSHNDGKVLHAITSIMKCLDENKENYARQMKKIQVAKQKTPHLHCDKRMTDELNMTSTDDKTDNDDDGSGSLDGNGDGGRLIANLLDDSD